MLMTASCSILYLPNGWRYPLVGGMRQRRFDGINSKPRKLLENAQTPTSRVHAVLGNLKLVQDQQEFRSVVCSMHGIFGLAE